MNKPTVNAEFLNSKSFSSYSPWCGYETEDRAQDGNMHRLSESVYTFGHYNLLPANETDVLDGHYTFFVNKDTFEWLAYKSSDYGSFTYVREVEFAGFITKDNLPEISVKRIESMIADKLLKAYFYDSKHINHQGQNLIEQGEYPNKQVLICDHRGYMWSDCKPEQYNAQSLYALNKLAGFVQPDIKDFDAETIKQIANKFRGMRKGTQKQVPINIAGTEYILVHQLSNYNGNCSALINKDGKEITHEIITHKLTDFIKALPAVLRNMA